MESGPSGSSSVKANSGMTSRYAVGAVGPQGDGCFKALSTRACSCGVVAAWGWMAPSATSSAKSPMRTSGLNGYRGAIDWSAVAAAGEAATSSSRFRSPAARVAQSSPLDLERADVHGSGADQHETAGPLGGRGDAGQKIDCNAERRHHEHGADVHVPRGRLRSPRRTRRVGCRRPDVHGDGGDGEGSDEIVSAASRRRHSNTASVATSEMPTSELFKVMPWNTASKPRLTNAGNSDHDPRLASPAGSCPQNNHHHAVATRCGNGGDGRRLPATTHHHEEQRAEDEERSETRRGHGNEPATTPNASRRSGGPSWSIRLSWTRNANSDRL